jgi:hypothetical protein
VSKKGRSKSAQRTGEAQPAAAVPPSAPAGTHRDRPSATFAKESSAPYGTEQPRSRGPLALLIVLCVAWLAFLVALSLRDIFR